MRCRECRTAIAGWLDGLLNESMNAEFESHLSACDACRAEADSAAGIHATLAALGVSGRSVRARVMDTISQGAVRVTRTEMTRRRALGFAAITAAAAAVLLAIFWWTTAGPKPAMSAWAGLSQAVQRSKSAKWMHLTEGRGDDRRERWISFNPPRYAVKRSEGIVYCDVNARKTYTYSYASGTVTVSSASEYADEYDEAANLVGFFEDFELWRDELRKDGIPVEMTSRAVDGGPYDVYTYYTARGVRSVAVDPVERRVVRVERHPPEGAASRAPVVVEIDYPDGGPGDIYAMGVPRGAKVLNWGYDEAKALEDNVEAAASAFAPRYFAIAVAQREYLPPTPADHQPRSHVTVEYAKGNRSRVEIYRERSSTLAAQADCEDAASLESWTRSRKPSLVVFYDGRDYKPGALNKTSFTVNSDGTLSKVAFDQPCRPFTPNTVGSATWSYRLFVSPRKVGLSLLPLPSKEGPNGRLEGIESIDSGRDPDGTPIRYRTRWYFNPQRDYAAEEFVLVCSASDAVGPVLSVDSCKVTRYGRTPAGRWYAREMLREMTGYNVKSREKIGIFVDTAREIPEDVFDLAKFEAEYNPPVPQ